MTTIMADIVHDRFGRLKKVIRYLERERFIKVLLLLILTCLSTKKDMLITHLSVRNNVTRLKMYDLLRTLTSMYIELVLLVECLCLFTGHMLNMIIKDFFNYSYIVRIC